MRKFVRLWELFERYARAHGVELLSEVEDDLVARWVRAKTAEGAPSASTQHLRRSAVRHLYQLLRQYGLADRDPTLDLRLPPRSTLSVRPLLDDEVVLCEWASLQTTVETRLPTCWALAEGGATTAEIPTVTRSDVDVGGALVQVAGSTKTEARVIQLTTWGATQISRRMRRLPPGPAVLLAYEGSGSEESRQASASAAIRRVLQRAGLASEPDVQPRSVTAWAGRRVFDQSGRIEAVAQRLGLRSLDQAAKAIAFDWRAAE